jgi:hypothetical protein
MLWRVLPFILVVILLLAVVAAGALANKLTCGSQEKLRGEEAATDQRAKDGKLAMVDKDRAVRVLSNSN